MNRLSLAARVVPILFYIVAITDVASASSLPTEPASVDLSQLSILDSRRLVESEINIRAMVLAGAHLPGTPESQLIESIAFDSPLYLNKSGQIASLARLTAEHFQGELLPPVAIITTSNDELRLATKSFDELTPGVYASSIRMSGFGPLGGRLFSD